MEASLDRAGRSKGTATGATVSGAFNFVPDVDYGERGLLIEKR
jgi:hypothetical protein